MNELQDSITKIAANFDNVQRMMREAETALANTKAEQTKAEAVLQATKQEHGALLGQLDAKKVAADKAADEAATRIQLNRDQTAELLRIREDNERRDKAISAREAAVSEIQKKLMSKAAELAAREHEVHEAENRMAARQARLQEAMS
jgi:hypothetical protein